MKIYISGGIHNQPLGADGKRGSDAFRNVANLVSQLGHIPVVPHDIPADHRSHDALVPPADCPPAYSPSAACHMRGDLIEMLQCDAVLMSGDWHHSVGAQREHSVACWTGMPIFYDARSLPDNRPLSRMKEGLRRTAEDLRKAKLPALPKNLRELVKHQQQNEAEAAANVLGTELSDGCPTCGSPAPERHPAVQHEGEVNVCRDRWHSSTQAGREVLFKATGHAWADLEYGPVAEEQKQAVREGGIGVRNGEELVDFAARLKERGERFINEDEESTGDGKVDDLIVNNQVDLLDTLVAWTDTAIREEEARLAAELRKYGYMIVEGDEWSGDELLAGKALVDQIAAWVSGERL